ncbi:MAG: 3'(2'),5'-bisphosphate nucleotidase [Rhizobiaceae bacterium]|nr:MAG: 3'(2'),5'-bisphosphate nucleotidase [Rhizobiaceae bacterium]
MKETDAAILPVLEELALAAGRAILKIREEGITVDIKPDASPVTRADREAERIILDGLHRHFPAVPIVAEEEASAGRLPERLGEAFFLVDPLDGTKEFVKGHSDFTVNIALIRRGVPEIGVVYAPARGVLYSGCCSAGASAVEIASDGRPERRQTITVRIACAPLTVVASRSHRTRETDDYLTQCPGAEILSVGSSLKFCMLAAGKADLYPRFGRTMEWDTAAGDAVLRAGGGMTSTTDGKPLCYGKRGQQDDADFANPWFIAATSRSLDPFEGGNSS